ncbi:MAG: hypothetical protein R2817_14835 [Flavobacteriales bacterium]
MNGTERWCLVGWKRNPADLKRMPKVMGVSKKNWRARPEKRATTSWACRPHCLREVRQPRSYVSLCPRCHQKEGR